SRQENSLAAQQNSSERPLTEQESAIKVTITTGGGLSGPVKALYHLGESVPVTITMANTSNQVAQVCVTGTLYQDLPKLVKDGQPLSYTQVQQSYLKDVNKDDTCKNLDVPEKVFLQPDQLKIVDWFTLGEGNRELAAMFWYDQLKPGKYELSLKRRFGCCNGPMVESNKISFEVVP
ncbi:MAG: hypothetical protein ACJ8LM_16080, partial [Candidatus Udaeobacter sp.]